MTYSAPTLRFRTHAPRRLLALLGAVFIFLALPALSQAVTFCVSASACPSGTTDEHGDLQKALNDALISPGPDTILLSDKGSPYLGPFIYTSRVGSPDPVDIHASGPGRPVLTAAPGATVLLAANAAIAGIGVQLPSAASGVGISAEDGTQLRDVVVQGPGGAGNAIGVGVNGAVTITGSQISGTGRDGVVGSLQLDAPPTSVDVAATQISDVTTGITNDGVGLRVDGSRISGASSALLTSGSTAVTRSVLESTGAGSDGVLAEGSHLTLDHTTVARRGAGSGVDVALHFLSQAIPGSADISSTVLAGYSHGVLRDTSQTGQAYPVTVRDSVWDHSQDNRGTLSSGPFSEQNDANVAPAVVDLIHGDFRPRGSSAAIDRDSQTDSRYTDIDGVAVVDGDGNGSLKADAGAFEYGRQAPSITSATVPASATAGDAVNLTSATTDADGDIVITKWSFGDGASGDGASTTHVYATAGTLHVTLTATDEAGLTATRAFTITVTGRPTGPTTGGTTGGTKDHTPPRLTTLRLTPNPVALAKASRVALRLQVSERSSLTVVARRQGAHSARQRATIVTRLAPGQDSIAIGAALKRRRVLTRGSWTLTLVATDAAGNRSRPQLLRLIVR